MTKKAKATLSNYVPINRKFFKHPFWAEERTFSKSEAWLDLIQAARFEESEAAALIGGKMVRWNRGQLPASLRYLAERWKWSKNKVDDFLGLLEDEGMVERHGLAGQTIISLCNYDEYNSSGQQKGQQKGQQEPLPHSITSDEGDSKKDSEGDTRGTGEGQAGDKSNKENKGNKEEDVGDKSPGPTDEQKGLFKNFKLWLSQHAPRVDQMKEPLTIEQYLKLREKIPKQNLIKILLAMQNRADLLKKNISANLTIQNWSKNEWNKVESTQNGKAQTINEDKAEAILRSAE
jgi:hypothetical protein